MPDQKKFIPFRVGKGNRPKIEEVIDCILDGDLKQSLLNFVNWLRENDMPIKLHSSTTRGHNARYKDEWICHILIYDKNEMREDYAYWSVAVCLNHTERYETASIDDEVKNLIWDGVRYCTRCQNAKGEFPPRDCAGGITVTILEKELNSVCAHKLPLPVFQNPNEKTIENIKRLIKIEKKARNDISVEC